MHLAVPTMLFSMMTHATRPARRKRAASSVADYVHHVDHQRRMEPHPADIETWVRNHKEVGSFVEEFNILLETEHMATRLKTMEPDSNTISEIEVTPTNVSVSNIMLTVKEFDLPKSSTENIYDALTTSGDVLKLYQKHIGYHPKVDFTGFSNCVEISFIIRSDRISIKVFTDKTSHITGFRDPSTGLDIAWMMHHVISTMHPPSMKKTHVCVALDNVHADFSLNLPSTCVMNTVKMRELVNNGVLDQFQNADFEFISVRPDYRFVTRNKREYTGFRINIMFRLYNNVYQVCVTLFATGNCIIRSKHPEAINKICSLMIKFFSLM